MKRIRVISDSNLPTEDNSVKEKVFEWALSEAMRQNLDCIIGAGDLTACGSAAAAERVWKKLENCRLPFAQTLGNADLRDSSEREKARTFLKTSNDLPGVCLLDTSRRELSPADTAKLRNIAPGTVVVTHCPQECLPSETQELFRQLLTSGRIALLISGHFHIDRQEGDCHLIRGLDPDKAAGSPPALAIFTNKNGKWMRKNHACPVADPDKWSDESKQEFLRYLGISGMSSPLKNFELATERNIGVFEFRFTLSQWYQITGSACAGYTLHQIMRDNQNEPMRGNFPLTTFSGRLISLSSFCMAWQGNILHHAPMILEIKENQGIASYDALKTELWN